MLMKLKNMLIPGVTWQHPVVNAGLRALDPVDWAVRAASGTSRFPRLSMRVRSNGVRGQFGGSRFAQLGDTFRNELIARAGVLPQSRVLEIGCGCGRNAFALSDTLENGKYTGVDVDAPSIQAATSNRFLARKGFRFEFIDVVNPEYNPNGQFEADSYAFDYEDGSFDVVFMVSVVTHLLPRDLEHYVAEIARMLAPGGRLVFTTFIMDHGEKFGPTEFKYGEGPWRSAHPNIPEICVGYYATYLSELLAGNGLAIRGKPVLSAVRDSRPEGEVTEFDQDIVVADKL